MSNSFRSQHLERVLGKLDDLDTQSLTILVQRLARERSLLETVFNVIKEGVLVIHGNGLIDYCNQAAHSILGLRDKDIGTLSLWKLLPDLADSLKINLSAETPNISVVSREMEIHYPEYRYLRLYLVPFPSAEKIQTPEDPENKLYALILSDVTQQEISTQELIETEKLSSIFTLAAGVAHEIGNPLNSINIHLQLLQRQVAKLEESADKEKILKSVNVCSDEVKRLDGIIMHFLEALRPATPDFQEADLFTILKDTLNFQQQELSNLDIDVEIQAAENLPAVFVDKNQTRQVFFNVIKNAMEAMGKGGKLKISAHCDDEFLNIYFADSGLGIEQKDLAHIFDPYHTTKEKGSGLGLMLVQRIMREHGGRIGIDSEPDLGTVISLQFPFKNKRVRMLETRK